MAFLSSVLNLVLSPLRLLLTYLVKLTPGLTRLATLSPAMRAALLTLLFLTSVIGISCLLFWWDANRNASGWGPWLAQLKFAIPIALAIVVSVYLFVRWWMTDIGTLYPSIDRAWKQGLSMLASEGYSIDEVPLFLVIGDTSRETASQSMNWARVGAERQSLGEAGGEPTLHWYLTDSGLFLFLSGISCVSRMHDEARENGGGAGEGRGAGGDRYTGTRVASLRGERKGHEGSGAAPLPGRRRGGEGPVGGGTAQFTPERGKGTFARRPRTHAAGARVTAAFVPGEETAPYEPVEIPGRDASPPVSTQDRRLIAVDASLYAEGEETLRYVARLIRSSRRPYVGVNGLLVAARFDLIDAHPEDMTQGIRRDLSLLEETCGVRAVTTVAVSGMDRVEGFDEFVACYGEQGAAEDRIGKGHSEWTEPTPDNLTHVAHLACDGLEEVIWETAIRQDADATREGSRVHEVRRMMRLWLRLRSGFADRLAAFLAGGLAVPDRRGAFPILFAGCYFIGTGLRPAFVENVMRRRVVELQDKIAWSERALRRDQRDQLVANLLLLAAVALVALFVAELWRGDLFARLLDLVG